MLELTHFYYTTTQLQLPLNLEVTFKTTDEVITFKNLIKEINFEKYFAKKTYGETRGRKKKSRPNLLKVILFAFSIQTRSTRDIADKCKHDTRFMYLLNGEEAPSHTTINRVISGLQTSVDDILTDITKQIVVKDRHVNLDITYIDGTKLEAYANKFSFVWKKAVLKNQAKLNKKIREVIPRLNELLLESGCDPALIKESYGATELAEVVARIMTVIKHDGINCVYGKGTRKTETQRMFDRFEEFSDKMLEYETHLGICGDNRNSYSKTDHDATFMRLKEDHMRNGQLKAAYNVQIAVSDEYVTGAELYQDRDDVGTFIPFINHLKRLYGSYPSVPVADAGYGCFDNYAFCQDNNVGLYQKYGMYAKEKEKNYRNNPFNKMNFKHEGDHYVCPNQQPLIFEKEQRMKRTKRKDGLEKVYRCHSCEGCPFKSKCTTSEYGRTITVNEEYEQMKKTVRNNLESDAGISLRVNRSIQVEGAFGVMKEDMRYSRFRRRSLAKARLEVILVAIGMNISKFHNRKYRIVQ